MNDSPRRGSLKVLILTVFVDLVGFSIIFPLFPRILEHYVDADGPASLIGQLSITLSRLAADSDNPKFYATVLFGGVLGSLYSILQFVFAPIWGRLSDRTGRRPILLISIAGLCLAYLVWVFAGTFWMLVVSRLVAGVMGGNIAVATAAVADLTGEKDRAKGMGLIGAAFGLGFILGPALGSMLGQIDLSKHLDLPGLNPFSAAALAGVVLSAWNIAWVYWKLPETHPPEARRTGTTPGRSSNPLKLFSGEHLPAGVAPTNMVFFLFQTAFAGMEFTLVFLATERLGYSSRDMMWIFIYIGVLIALVQGGVVRRLAPKLGERRVARDGLVLLVPGLVLVGLADGQFVFYVGLGLLAVGSALVSPCLSALVSLYTPADRQGEVLGRFRSLGALSRAIAPIIAGVLYWKFGAEWPYFGGGLLMLVPLAMVGRLPDVSR